MTQHDEKPKEYETFVFKGEELRTYRSGFFGPFPSSKVGRKPVKADDEKVDAVVKKVQEGISNAYAELNALEEDKAEHIRKTNVERMRKKVRKVLNANTNE